MVIVHYELRAQSLLCAPRASDRYASSIHNSLFRITLFSRHLAPETFTIPAE